MTSTAKKNISTPATEKVAEDECVHYGPYYAKYSKREVGSNPRAALNTFALVAFSIVGGMFALGCLVIVVCMLIAVGSGIATMVSDTSNRADQKAELRRPAVETTVETTVEIGSA